MKLLEHTLGWVSQLWIWGAVVLGIVIVAFVLQNKKVQKVLNNNSDLITLALNSVKDIVEYLEKNKKIGSNVAETIHQIREIGLLAVTSAEEQANGGLIDPKDKYSIAKEIAKTILKQNNITLSDNELDAYLNSALNIARATGVLSEKKKLTKKKVKKSELEITSNLQQKS